MAYRILFVGDEPAYAEASRLSAIDGVQAKVLPLAKGALTHLFDHGADLLVLDSELADMPAMSFLRVLRRTDFARDLPAILLASRKSRELVVEGFGLGLEDLMARPIDARELVLRVKAVLRRRYERADGWAPAVAVGPVKLDPSRRLCLVDGAPVELRPAEFSLLETLLRREGRVLTRAFLSEAAWGAARPVESRAVDVAISSLRRRLGPAGAAIVTIYKGGYSFRVSEAPAAAALRPRKPATRRR